MDLIIKILKKILKAVVIFVVAWLVFWLVAMILVALPTDPTIWLGNLLNRIAVVLAALVAVVWFISGDRWMRF